MMVRALGAVALALLASSGASAQEPQPHYRVGILSPGPIPDTSPIYQALVATLAKRGDVPGETLTFERLSADGDVGRLPALAARLVAEKVDAIFTVGYPPALAAARSTGTVPIVVLQAGDPVRTGMVRSLAHPGGNITGMSEDAEELSAKRLEVLKDAVPGLKRVAMLWNASDLGMSLREKAADAAAVQLGITVESLGVRAPDDFNEAFETMDKDPPGAILMVTDILTNLNRKRVYDYAMTHRLPAIFEYDSFVKEGGLMSYGPDQSAMASSAADLLDRVLKGAKPADLPVEEPTRFVFAVNLKTAKALRLTLPESVLIRVDEVIE